MRPGGGLVLSSGTSLSGPTPGGEGLAEAVRGTGPEAGGGAWRRVARTTPIRRTYASLVYHVGIERVVLFGGFACPETHCEPLGDTWAWDGERWAELKPATSPPARYAAAAAYDAARGEIVVFGGYDGSSRVGLADTWTFDGTSWARESPAASPPPLAYASMAYDEARQRVVLFGGCLATDLACARSSQTWTWDGSTWTLETSTSSPTPRYGPGMAYDGARQRVVLFGGYGADGSALGDTWAWDGTTWAPMPAEHSPGPRGLPGMVYDAARREVVLFGGNGRTCTAFCANAYRNDTWTWDGSDWKAAGGDAPSVPFETTGVTYDAARKQMVLFSGFGQWKDHAGLIVFAYPRNTWTWDGSGWREVPSTIPEERIHGTAAYHPDTGVTMLFGGICVWDVTCGIWTWDGKAWTEQPPEEESPPPMWYAPLVYHGPSRSLVVLAPYGDTWTWTTTEEGTRWHRVTPPASPAPGRYAAQSGHDALGRVVLFGGQSGGTYPGDTWAWDGSRWTQQVPSASPPGRGFGAMATLGSSAVLFGGSSAGSWHNDTWTWDETGWALHEPATRPRARGWTNMAYDPGSERLVLLGGLSGPSPDPVEEVLPHSHVLRDMWIWDGAEWTELHPGVAPLPRFGGQMAGHDPTGSVVLFGGQDANPGVASSATWIWTSG